MPGASDAGCAVTAAFYPLQWAAERVGGEHVAVTGLTKPGAEPHDLELTPKAVGELAAPTSSSTSRASSPPSTRPCATQAPDAGFDVSPDADLTLAATDDGHDHAGETADEHEEHADEAGAKDPHFWLDPVRLPVRRDRPRRALRRPPTRRTRRPTTAPTPPPSSPTSPRLDAEFEAGLARCRSDELVTGHAAFAYLADRYGLSQEGIAGLTPDAEPDAATLRELAAHVARARRHAPSTARPSSTPALAETLARETGATVAVLDPLEGLTDASTRHATTLRSCAATSRSSSEGQGCS